MWETVEKGELLSLSFLSFRAELLLTAGVYRLLPTPRLPPLPLCSLLSKQRRYTEKGTFLYFGCWAVIFKASPSKHFPHPCLFFSLKRRCTPLLKSQLCNKKNPPVVYTLHPRPKETFDVTTNPTPDSSSVASKGFSLLLLNAQPFRFPVKVNAYGTSDTWVQWPTTVLKTHLSISISLPDT